MKIILDGIIDYINKENTDYAIMITGDWGSGKTYFWSKAASPAIESINIDNGKPYKVIYISLYGLKSTDEISKKICMEYYSSMIKSSKLRGLFDNKYGKAVPELGKMLLNVGKALGYNPLDGEIALDYDSLYSLENTVLCFDDLERSQIPISEVLGYINNFVEHDKVKCIILSNEQEILDREVMSNIELKYMVSSYILAHEGTLTNKNQNESDKLFKDGTMSDITKEDVVRNKVNDLFSLSNDYKRMKEKLIRKTYNFKTDTEEIIKGILERYSSDFGIFLCSNENLIRETFNSSSSSNLRILKHALDDYEKIYTNSISFCEKIKVQLLEAMLIFTLAYSFELKAGKINTDEFIKAKSNTDFQSSLIMAGMFEDRAPTFITKFNNKYFSQHDYDFKFFKFIEVFIRTGLFEVNLFVTEMNEEIIKYSQEEQVPSHHKLRRYWTLSNQEFDEAINESYENYKHGMYHFSLYFEGYTLFKFFIKRGLLKLDVDVLKQEFMCGLENSVEHSQYNDDIDYIFHGSENVNDQDINEFKSKIYEINSRLQSKKYQIESDDLLRLLSEFKLSEFYEKLDNEYYASPIFTYFNVDELFRLLLQMSNEQVVFIRKIFNRRYNYIRDEFVPEVYNLDQLNQLLGEHINARDRNLGIVLLEDLHNTLGDILSRFEKHMNKDKAP
ncbi:KAP family P-loop domain-containing protein [Paenibacillus sp. UNCCL117]|uniref:P-loop NTPase fold protein n=1 Tax=unclassified Paenibacillus TaxID=185978 RepID=UPI000885239A|nr:MULTISPECIES: P-loop NTPase fold protein [unclassified Paenibacillus]SDD37587.1 KAP family P-loop domain-containing protein [Paenibacillus sp. cl123]SFW48754.1 KAP family P-loop domain-containing protein [Paenibacillus sp. UNCCL117]